MLTLLLIIGAFYVFGKLFMLTLKACVGLGGFLLLGIFFPAIIVALVVASLIYLAIPLLIIGIILSIGFSFKHTIRH